MSDTDTADEVVDISCTPPKKRAKRLHFSVSEKQIILNIYKHEMHGSSDSSVQDIVCKVASISGVSRASVYRIVREYRSNHSLVDPKNYPPRKKINDAIDDFDRIAIRRIVHNLKRIMTRQGSRDLPSNYSKKWGSNTKAGKKTKQLSGEGTI
ncbi:unnamed protein product [Acanthoscelides obtectus]|uniref:Uncharacterized protein n=1 Tax=Acanthoscelides obtectus TaxID=200917 RepID=A0A9P0LFN1_ACAOB|nr:unnamed protein product [Acanthoscelides obtectus]CAK1649110.1 hypothetical protein AOBTE_LOCUS16050 [Acanthoscelides obtectus]